MDDCIVVPSLLPFASGKVRIRIPLQKAEQRWGSQARSHQLAVFLKGTIYSIMDWTERQQKVTGKSYWKKSWNIWHGWYVRQLVSAHLYIYTYTVIVIYYGSDIKKIASVWDRKVSIPASSAMLKVNAFKTWIIFLWRGLQFERLLAAPLVRISPGAPDLRQRRNGNSNLFLRFFTNEIWGKKHLSLILLSLWPRFWGGTSGIFLKMAQTKGEGSKSIPVLINIHKSTGMFCTELRQAIPGNSWWKWRWWLDGHSG